MKFFNAPIRPELSCSMAPQFCDFIRMNLNACQIQIRMSGMTSPIITLEDYEVDCNAPLNMVVFLTGPLFGAPPDQGTEIVNDFKKVLDKGVRVFQQDMPRGTLCGSGLDYINNWSPADPAWVEMEPSTFEQYLRLNGMRRGRAEIEKEWARIEECRISGQHPSLEPYPRFTAPGGGCFLS